MKGAIAAGHPLTAEAGARVLEAGGNAIDACVAAAFVSWIAEAPLTGPGGGGFMLVHSGDRTRVLDFFVAVPAGGPHPDSAPMEAVDVVFEGSEAQVFLIGAASVAVPGTVAGLEAAHRQFGSLPWAELCAPAVELARRGVELTEPQAYLHAILDAILRHAPEGRTVFGGERAHVLGELFAQPALADTLERIGANGAAEIYGGENRP